MVSSGDSLESNAGRADPMKVTFGDKAHNCQQQHDGPEPSTSSTAFAAGTALANCGEGKYALSDGFGNFNLFRQLWQVHEDR